MAQQGYDNSSFDDDNQAVGKKVTKAKHGGTSSSQKRIPGERVSGRNTVAIQRRIPLVSDIPAIIFGADVTHPQLGKYSSPICHMREFNFYLNSHAGIQLLFVLLIYTCQFRFCGSLLALL
ncbi:hypothetical protein DVH24_039020 [Malus domestica]|uniref:Piwi domain-containing protein n=1 Tax=Malus domestica TaxID=3750 RepID=A0A498KBL1_MALDO|nr:hypothetical protein DVH24_039020 [Malus domestica]